MLIVLILEVEIIKIVNKWVVCIILMSVQG